MSPITLGILAASGAGLPGSYELISSTILSSSAASVTFSGLSVHSANYRHLQIRYTEYYTAGGYSSTMNFNGDFGANYSAHGFWGQGSALSSGALAAPTYMLTNMFAIGHTDNSNYRSVGVIDIFDAFQTSKFKTIRTVWGQAAPSANIVGLHSGSWRSTNAITSITMGTNGSPILAAGSRFSLYGIRG